MYISAVGCLQVTLDHSLKVLITKSNIKLAREPAVEVRLLIGPITDVWNTN